MTTEHTEQGSPAAPAASSDFIRTIVAEDRQAGKHTLAVLLGGTFAKGEYLACLLVAFLCLPVFCAFGLLPWGTLLAWLALPLAIRLCRIVFTQTGPALNAALAGTGQLALAFSVLFLLGMLLAG